MLQNGVVLYMEDTVHYETLLTSESLAGVRTFIHDGGMCNPQTDFQPEGFSVLNIRDSLGGRDGHASGGRSGRAGGSGHRQLGR